MWQQAIYSNLGVSLQPATIGNPTSHTAQKTALTANKFMLSVVSRGLDRVAGLIAFGMITTRHCPYRVDASQIIFASEVPIQPKCKLR